MYTGYELSRESREKLARFFPPQYPDFIGHHITLEFGTKPGTPVPEAPQKVEVVGYVDDGRGVEGFLVEVDGTSKRPTGGRFHITWSIDRSKGRKPFHTNDIISRADPIPHIKIDVTPKVFA